MNLVAAFLLRSCLWLLSPLTLIYKSLFFLDQLIKKPKALPFCYVISVGNISVGGTGKTPFVQYLIQKLKKSFPDFKFTILSRGYKASLSFKGAEVLIGSSPNDVGDEPLLLKQKFPEIQVIIGRDRHSSFLEFNRVKMSNHIVILDDGFQHHRLKRNFNIVLLDSSHPLGNGFTLPLGTLRESVSALKRADAVVFTKATLQNRYNIFSVIRILKKRFPQLPVFQSTFKIYNQSQIKELSNTLFYHIATGVGNPQSVLESALSYLGKVQITMETFPDHFEYSEGNMQNILNKLKPNEALVTTGKDWVKWKALPLFIKNLREASVNLIVMEPELIIDNENDFIALLESHVSSYAKEISLV